jgi:hypothetical protein
MKYLEYILPVLCIGLATSASALAQQPAQLLNAPSEASPATVAVAAVATTTTPAAPKPLLSRWLDLETLSHSERYRNAFAVGGDHFFNNAQQRSLVVGKIKLDPRGQYIIGFRASSGRYFNWAFGSYTGESAIDRVNGAGFASTFYTPAEQFAVYQAELADPAGQIFIQTTLKSNGWQFYMRELYFSATPVKPVTVEFGSFGFERGLSTEITTFDEDGYLSGERIRIHDSKHLFFDEVGFTNAFFGDLGTPNLFDRGLSLTKSNYRQVFANKHLTRRIGFSGEYTWQEGTNTLRQAVVVGAKEFRVVDSIRFEGYERLNSAVFPGVAQSPIGPIASASLTGASGFAVAAEKKFGRLSGDVGYASIDNNYSAYSGSRLLAVARFPLNGDAYGQGKRPFVHASYKIAPGVTAFGFYTHEVGSERVITLNQQGLNAGVTFDLKALVNSQKLIF